MDFGLEKHFFLQQSNKNILYKILYHLLVLQEPGSEITKRAVILFEYYLNIVNLTLYTSNLSLFHSINFIDEIKLIKKLNSTTSRHPTILNKKQTMLIKLLFVFR